MDKLVVANWKMNPASRAEAETLAAGYRTQVPRATGVQVVACPPMPYLALLHDLTPAIQLGAQDVFWEESGAHTGAVSPLQLKNLGVSWVILGHSERRAAGETDENISKKMEAAQMNSLRTILCVGESAELHAQKAPAIEKFLHTQLDNGLARLKDPSLLVICYEPIWAISAQSGGTPDDPADAMDRIAHIKQYIATKFNNITPPVLYGGSVSAGNAHNFFKYAAIDGVLVGAASLDATAFKGIVQSAVNAVTASPVAYLEKE